MSRLVFDLVAWLHQQIDFSAPTFGPGKRTKGILQHIEKELREVEADPDSLEEWVDIAILALDGAWRAGHSPTEIAYALQAKLEKNKARDWADWRTRTQDEAIEHLREEPIPTRLPVGQAPSYWGVDGEEMFSGVEIVEKATGAAVHIVRFSPPKNRRHAEKTERMVKINLNHDEYTTRLRPA